MKKIFFIMILNLSILSAKGQTITRGNSTWTNITHDVKQLVFTNEKIQSQLEGLLNCAKQNVPEEFEYYKYINLYVRENTSSHELEFRLSNYPYKSNSNIGFFSIKGHLILVHDKLPDFLKPTEYKKTFSYMEYRIFFSSDSEGVVMNEDDTPSWIIEYNIQDGSIKIKE